MSRIVELVKNTRSREVSEHQSPHEYNQERKFFSYHNLLPEWKGKALGKIIEERIESGQTPVKILDIGCGRAQFLKECRKNKKWRNYLLCDGIDIRLGEEITLSKKAQSEITLIEGDAQRISKFIKPDTYDLVVSMRAFEYLADLWAALKGVYRVLKPDGIALIHYLPYSLNLTGTDFEKIQLVNYLSKRYGMNFEIGLGDVRPGGIYNLSFSKKEETLKLPLSYSGTKEIDFDFPDNEVRKYSVLTYSLSPEPLCQNLLRHGAGD